MYLLALLIEITAIYLAVKKARKALARRKKPEKSDVLRATRNHSKEEIKATKQAEKEQIKAIQQTEKQHQKRQQAEADILFYQKQLDTITGMLSNADNELSEIEKQININKLMRSYDKIRKEEKRKTQVLNRIMVLENKVHTIETKIAKSEYILQAV